MFCLHPLRVAETKMLSATCLFRQDEGAGDSQSAHTNYSCCLLCACLPRHQLVSAFSLWNPGYSRCLFFVPSEAGFATLSSVQLCVTPVRNSCLLSECPKAMGSASFVCVDPGSCLLQSNRLQRVWSQTSTTNCLPSLSVTPGSSYCLFSLCAPR